MNIFSDLARLFADVILSRLPVASDLLSFALSVEEGSGPFGVDTSIEGMKSQEFSVGIFYFLIASIVIFTIFVFMFMMKGKSSLKRGEKIMFVWILLGVVVAVVFGAAQMLHGYLF